MSYDAVELTIQTGKPVFLYEFVQEATTWRYTSAPTDVTWNSETWTASAISHTEITQSGELSRDSVSLTFPRTDAFARLFLHDAIDAITSVTIRRGHPDDGEFVVFWRGRVAAGKGERQNISVDCESIFTGLRRPGLRARYQKTCRHALYGRGCNLDHATFAVASGIDAISAEVVTVTNADLEADGHYFGGMIEYGGVFRYVIKHVGKDLTLLRPFTILNDAFSADPSIQVNIYPGCDHTLEACISKFDNEENFGGFPWIPRKNSMDGSAIL